MAIFNSKLLNNRGSPEFSQNLLQSLAKFLYPIMIIPEFDRFSLHSQVVPIHVFPQSHLQVKSSSFQNSPIIPPFLVVFPYHPIILQVSKSPQVGPTEALPRPGGVPIAPLAAARGLPRARGLSADAHLH